MQKLECEIFLSQFLVQMQTVSWRSALWGNFETTVSGCCSVVSLWLTTWTGSRTEKFSRACHSWRLRLTAVLEGRPSPPSSKSFLRKFYRWIGTLLCDLFPGIGMWWLSFMNCHDLVTKWGGLLKYCPLCSVIRKRNPIAVLIYEKVPNGK